MLLLLVGLGNPGEEYAWNRHNIGFRVVEAIARRHGIGPWRPGFHGVTARGTIAERRVLLLKPITYMNESGRAVAEAAHFYRVDISRVVVFHDEIELPSAKLRVKMGGRNCGHNGLGSITECIGNDYRRVRIGVDHPGHRDLVHAHVLGNFPKSERDWVEAMCDVIADNVEFLVRGDDATFQNKVHLAMDAKGFVERVGAGRARRGTSFPTES